MPMCGHVPSAAAVIVTLKALRAQGGSRDGPVDLGFPNLARHFDNLKRWGVQPVVALNRFPGDTGDDLDQVLKFCGMLGADAAICEGYTKGGDGMREMAAKIVDAASKSDANRVKPIYRNDQSLIDKITTVATQVYGAAQVAFKPAAKSRLEKFEALGYGTLPVCIAKTQYSFTDDPKQPGAPVGWTLTISDVSLSAGAGFVVAIAGSMMLMPGLGKLPQAQKLDVDDQGRAIGMDY